MGHVLEFPSQQAQCLAYLDRHIRQLLTERGADQELIDFAAERLTRNYARIHASGHCRLELTLPDNLPREQSEALQSDILAGLGVSYVETGQFDKALPVLQQALNIAAGAGNQKLVSQVSARINLCKQNMP